MENGKCFPLHHSPLPPFSLGPPCFWGLLLFFYSYVYFLVLVSLHSRSPPSFLHFYVARGSGLNFLVLFVLSVFLSPSLQAEGIDFSGVDDCSCFTDPDESVRRGWLIQVSKCPRYNIPVTVLLGVYLYIRHILWPQS